MRRQLSWIAVFAAAACLHVRCAPVRAISDGPVASSKPEALWQQLSTQGPLASRRAAVELMHAQGLASIAFLVTKVADAGDIAVILQNPHRSRLDQLSTKKGLLAAYLVDLILAKSKLSIPRTPGDGLLLGASPENYLYWSGEVVGADGHAVSAADLGRVQEAYARWWQANAGRGLDALRADWRAGRKPLDGSPYHWQ